MWLATNKRFGKLPSTPAVTRADDVVLQQGSKAAVHIALLTRRPRLCWGTAVHSAGCFMHSFLFFFFAESNVVSVGVKGRDSVWCFVKTAKHVRLQGHSLLPHHFFKRARAASCRAARSVSESVNRSLAFVLVAVAGTEMFREMCAKGKLDEALVHTVISHQTDCLYRYIAATDHCIYE